MDEVLVNPVGAPTGDILGVLPNLKNPDQAFVYYAGTHELYRVDLVSRVQTLEASPIVVASALHVPGLGAGYQSQWAADYAGRGYCYFFLRLHLDPAAAPVDTLVCIDADRDGKLDTSRLLDAGAWQSEGWGDPANILGPP